MHCGMTKRGCRLGIDCHRLTVAVVLPVVSAAVVALFVVVGSVVGNLCKNWPERCVVSAISCVADVCDGIVVPTTVAAAVIRTGACNGIVGASTTTVAPVVIVHGGALVYVPASASVKGICIVIRVGDGACFRSGCDRGAVTSARHILSTPKKGLLHPMPKQQKRFQNRAEPTGSKKIIRQAH